jgi:hypothetical protein
MWITASKRSSLLAHPALRLQRHCRGIGILLAPGCQGLALVDIDAALAGRSIVADALPQRRIIELLLLTQRSRLGSSEPARCRHGPDVPVTVPFPSPGQVQPPPDGGGDRRRQR